MENDNLRELEAEKLKCEISKIRTEEEEIRKRISEGVWNRKTIIQTVVGGIVAAGLLVVWLLGYFQPIMGKKQEMLEIQNKIDALNNQKQLDSIGTLLQRQQREKDSLIIVKENFRKSRDEIKNKLKEVSILYENKTFELDKKEREYQRLELKQAIKEISDNLVKIDIPKDTLSPNEEIKNWLMDKNWIIEYDGAISLPSFKHKRKKNCDFLRGGNFIFDGEAMGNSWKVEGKKLTINIQRDSIIVTAQITESSPYLIKANAKKKTGKEYWEIKITK